MKKLLKKDKNFVAYITAGHRGMEYSESSAMALINGGVDVLEIGVPFSDPLADGPVIQQAMNDALHRGVTLEDVFELVGRLKKMKDIPIIIFSYYNPFFSYGIDLALSKCQHYGVDGVLIVDLPYEEGLDFCQACYNHHIVPVGMLAPSSCERRIKKVSSLFKDLIYYVCRTGVTGTQTDLGLDYDASMSRIKQLVKQPIISGFGIRSKDQASQVIACSQGFVVGSLFVDAMSRDISAQELTQLAQSINPL